MPLGAVVVKAPRRRHRREQMILELVSLVLGAALAAPVQPALGSLGDGEAGGLQRGEQGLFVERLRVDA